MIRKSWGRNNSQCALIQSCSSDARLAPVEESGSGGKLVLISHMPAQVHQTSSWANSGLKVVQLQGY